MMKNDFNVYKAELESSPIQRFRAWLKRTMSRDIIYTFYVDIQQIKNEHKYTSLYISKMVKRAKSLCDQGKLFVTLNGTIPKEVEDIVGFVTDIKYSIRGKFIVVQIQLYLDPIDGIISPGEEIRENISRGRQYDCHIIEDGKLITLTKQANHWPKLGNYKIR